MINENTGEESRAWNRVWRNEGLGQGPVKTEEWEWNQKRGRNG